MGKLKLSEQKISKIIKLRETGHSYPEIQKIVKCGYATCIKYGDKVAIQKNYKKILRDKQGGSKRRSEQGWDNSKILARKLLGKLDSKNKLCLLIGLYWGEGTKRELNIINGDQKLLKVFLSCIKEIGVKDQDLIFSLRVYGKHNVDKTLSFWSKELNIQKSNFKVGEILQQSKENKLPNGMCRIRVKKGANYFKLIMSMIQYVSEQL